MALSRSVWSAGKVLLLLAALVATFVLSFVGAMRVALRTREVAVPPLAGRTVNEASAALDEIGLALRVEEQRRLDARDGIGYHHVRKRCPGWCLSPSTCRPAPHGERSRCTRPRRFAPRSAAG